MLRLDLPAHAVEQLFAQPWNQAGQLFELMQRNGTYHRGVQGNGIAGVTVLTDGVQADQLAR
ncbi:hypothetical protein D3C78_1816540 [compost metagenome]